MASSRIGVAVVGLGRDSVSRLSSLLASSQRLQVRWVVDKNTVAARQQLQRMFPSNEQPQVIKPWHWPDMCADNSVDAVLVCSPVPGVNMIRKSLSRGKAVMCEYPVSLQKEAVMACYEQAEKVNKPLLISFDRRFDEHVQHIRKRVQSGVIGKVNSIRSSTSHAPFSEEDIPQQLGLHAFFRDCVTQEIDTLNWILGETPTTVFATGAGLQETDSDSDTDSVSMTMRFPAGTIATVEVKQTSESQDHFFEIGGSEGILMVDPNHPKGTAVHTVSRNGTRTELVEETLAERKSEGFTQKINHFLDVIEGKATPHFSVIDILSITSAANACEASHRSNSALFHQMAKQCQKAEVLIKQPLWKEDPDLEEYTRLV